MEPRKILLTPALLAIAATLSFQAAAIENAEGPAAQPQPVQVPDDEATSARVRASLQASLEESTSVGAAEVQVVTYNGAVHLIGFVDNAQDAEAMVALAQKVDGVRSVVNAIQVRSWH